MELNHIFEKIKVTYWYQITLAIGVFFLVLSLTVNMVDISNYTVQAMSLALILIGLGETANHTFKTTAGNHGNRPYVYKERVRKDRIIGWLLNIIGFLFLLGPVILEVVTKYNIMVN